jgi:hypothetical protein
VLGAVPIPEEQTGCQIGGSKPRKEKGTPYHVQKSCRCHLIGLNDLHYLNAMPEEPKQPPAPAPTDPIPPVGPPPQRRPAVGDEKMPLWVWPIGVWLAVLVPAVPTGLYALATGGLAALWGLVRLEAVLGGIAVTLSVVLGLATWLAHLFRR